MIFTYQHRFTKNKFYQNNFMPCFLLANLLAHLYFSKILEKFTYHLDGKIHPGHIWSYIELLLIEWPSSNNEYNYCGYILTPLFACTSHCSSYPPFPACHGAAFLNSHHAFSNHIAFAHATLPLLVCLNNPSFKS